MPRAPFLLDPCDLPFGRCAACQALVDVEHIATPDGEKDPPPAEPGEHQVGTCPGCGASLHTPDAIGWLDEPELLLMDGRCPHCGERATFRWSDDTVARRVDPDDATKDEIIEGHVICNHCGFEFEGISPEADADPGKRQCTVVRKLGLSRKRRASGRRLQVGPRADAVMGH